MNENIEKRFLSEEAQFRAFEEDGKNFLEGYAAIFNSQSRLLSERGIIFYEQLERTAFDNVLKEENLDVYLTFNHSRDQIIARTISGSLKLSTDDTGLFFRAEIPNVSYAQDVYELVKRGDLVDNSFAFQFADEDMTHGKAKDGLPLRTVSNVRNLIDVSVVTKGAYAETEVEARGLKEYIEKEETENAPKTDIYFDEAEKRFRILKLKKI